MGHLSSVECVTSLAVQTTLGNGSQLMKERHKTSQSHENNNNNHDMPNANGTASIKYSKEAKDYVAKEQEHFATNGMKLVTDANGIVQLSHKIDLDEYTRNFKGDTVLGIEFKAPLKWDRVIQISLLHIVCFVCLILYPLNKLTFYTTLWAFFTGGVAGFGVTAGAHRYWTHRSYKANLPLRIILMMCFALAGQNSLYDWVRDHRVHHKYSETDADPHNSNRGFFFAHVGWLMMAKHPEVLRRGRQMDMSDILNDPVVRFQCKYFIALKTIVCFLLPTLVPIYFWNEEWHLAFITQCLFRHVSSLNFTWSVNSAAHMWGSHPYDKRINPSENLCVSIIAMGEGWHNYHHVFPWDYKAAELGQYCVNFTTMVLDAFHRIGWAWDMKEPSKDLVRRTLEKYGDGTHESVQHTHVQYEGGHCHYPEIPDPEFAEDDGGESSSTESSKLDENANHKVKACN